MNQTASILLSATAAFFTLGVGVGFYLGKIRGMKLGVEARDFAESFGIGKQNVQAGASQLAAGNTLTIAQYQQAQAQAQIHKMIVGAGGGGGGGYAIAQGSGGLDLNELHRKLIQNGMSPADAQNIISAEIQRRKQQAMYAAALGAQKRL